MDIAVLKQYLGFDSSDTSRDTLLQSLADSAIAAIDEELGYHTASHSVTQQSTGSSQIAFTDLPVSSLVVKYRGTLTDTVGTSDETLTAWTDYYIFPRHIDLKCHKSSEPRIILTYNAGWNVLPPDIENAMRLWVKYNFQGLSKLQAGETVDTRIPREIAQLLKHYKHLELP
jgi:hypothetical protein